jgi:hypothetical protein
MKKPELIYFKQDKTKLSDNINILNLIAANWGLKLNRPLDFKIAVRIMKNSIKYN